MPAVKQMQFHQVTGDKSQMIPVLETLSFEQQNVTFENEKARFIHSNFQTKLKTQMENVGCACDLSLLLKL